MVKQEDFYYGGDYNLEQWDQSVWEEDMRLMKKAGVNLVSINIFSWANLQPDELTYNFHTLDKIMDLLAAQGIKADLATATAAPPAWLARKYPESLPVDRNGTRLLPGSRQHYCPNSTDYKRLSKALAEKIARRYRSHPALVMWHINNEYGCHVSECYCDNCRKAFQTWLRKKYQTIDKLNKSWSTDFWSQRYYNWEEIHLPGKTPTFANPGQQLDYKRFMNDSILSLYKNERDVIKKYTPDVPVTTNLLGLHKPINGFLWAKEMDVAAWDAYPDPFDNLPCESFMAHDLTRSLKKSPFLLMEQAAGAVNWREQNAVKIPGRMRLWSYEAIAHGADGILFFQWRAAQGGAEKFHSGMVPHSNDENSRVFREVSALGRELKKCKELIGSAFCAEVAMIFEWENWWALELDSKPSNLIRYIEQLLSFYRILRQLNISVDFVRPGEKLDKYKVIFAPASYQVSKPFSDQVKTFIKNGGTFVTNFFSGIVNEDERVYLGGYPGAYKDVLGIYVEEFSPMRKEVSHQIKTLWGDMANRIWEEAIHLKGAEAIAWFQNGYLAGMPAVTRHRFGSGKAYYLGTQPEDSFLTYLFREILSNAHAGAPINVPEGVEVTKRIKGSAEYYFILNHSGREKIFVIDQVYDELLTGLQEKQVVRIPPMGVKIYKKNNEHS
ncbi:beta-galactosidase [Sporolactobacillus sp. THM7-4]|nr:beta-galactosidase [Sporolactobacillus sp. THM7-4]